MPKRPLPVAALLAGMQEFHSALHGGSTMRTNPYPGDVPIETWADLEESPHARAVVLGVLRERELRGES